MEPRRSLILYVRTSDKVLLRFSDLETPRSWIEARRLSLDDEFLATDQTWQPLHRLFRIDLPSPGSHPGPHRPESPGKREPATPLLDPEQVPTVPFFPDALEPGGPTEDTPGVREGPTRVSSPRTSDILFSEPTKGANTAQPARSVPDGAPMRIRSIESGSTGPDLWGEEPDAPRLAARRRIRRILRWVVIPGVVCVGAAVAWLASDRSSGSEESARVARSSPAVPEKATVPPTPAPSAARSVATVVPVPENPPAAPPPPEPTSPGRAADTGSPPEPPPAMPSVPPTPSVASGPPAPGRAPESPPVATPRPLDRPVPGREAPESSPTISHVPEDMSYDQHMAEGMKWLSRDPKKAHAHFQAASHQRPGSVEPKAKMAECEYRLGHLREAAALYQQALDVNPEYGPAIVGLARTHDRMGNTKDARFLYMKYLDVNPHGSHAPEARAYLGR